MKTIFLSCSLAISYMITYQSYAQLSNKNASYVNAVSNLQQTMPRKATIDGKRIYNVVADNICSITVTMESSRQYQFSLMNWPEKSKVDDSGYIGFILQDTDNKPHILRTDKVKGKQFLTSMKNLIENCQKSIKNNEINDS